MIVLLEYFVLQNFYMIGRDKSRTYWRVLKIDRLDPSELNIREDSTTYTESQCSDLLRRIHEGNKATGGLKFVTTCYGIVGRCIECILVCSISKGENTIVMNIGVTIIVCFSVFRLH